MMNLKTKCFMWAMIGMGHTALYSIHQNYALKIQDAKTAFPTRSVDSN